MLTRDDRRGWDAVVEPQNPLHAFSLLWEHVIPQWMQYGYEEIAHAKVHYFADTWEALKAVSRFDGDEWKVVFAFAVAFTILRFFVVKYILTPIANSAGLIQAEKEKNVTKFTESSWKVMYYLSIWLATHYVLQKPDFPYFYRPAEVWRDWAPGAPVQPEIYWIYAIAAGFYLHAIYATAFMDEKRKDYIVMYIHHIVTLALIGFSYAVRYHNIGLVVLYLHDISDVFLELAKVFLTFKITKKGYSRIGDIGSTGFFALFTLSWVLFRLYWLPTKVLVSSGAWAKYVMRTPPFYILFNGLLWTLQWMHIYWFMFILRLLFKMSLGGSVEDTRDYDENEAANSEGASSPKSAAQRRAKSKKAN